MHCQMLGCTSRYGQGNRRFFGFPKDPERARQWVEACGLEMPVVRRPGQNYASAHVCDLHFRQRDMHVKYLKTDAIPIPFNVKPTEDQSIQTNNIVIINSDVDTSDESQGANTFKEPQLKMNAEVKRALLDEVKSAELDEMNAELLKLIDSKVERAKSMLLNPKKKATSNKLYALFLYLTGPITYKTFRSSLNLPTEKELKKLDVDVDDIMSFSVMDSLKIKVNYLHVKDRHCTVCLKKVPLTRFLYYRIAKDKVIGFQNVTETEALAPATHAYVLIARGLRTKWEQPIAYRFLSHNQTTKQINSWLDEVISSLLFVGFEVAALVVDPEDLYKHFRMRIVCIVQPYFLVNERKIYCIFDLPQLIISLRNTLMTHELQFLDDDGSKLVADWGLLRAMYKEYEVDGKCLLVPKLTKTHIDPEGAEKKELKYAVQVFSRSVSQALELDMKRRKLDYGKLKGTQKLIELVNDVFDILNSSVINHHNKRKNAFTGEPYQMKTIRNFMEFLTDVKPVGCSLEEDSFDCIFGLRITIMSFTILLRDLLPKGITSLVTHRFNMDAAERFCRAVRLKSKTEKPTPVQFYKYFRQIFMIELLKCPENSDKVDNLENFGKAMKTPRPLTLLRRKNEFRKTIEVCTVDYRFDVPASDGFKYVCWYLLKKCYEQHTCDKVVKECFKFTANDTRWDNFFSPPDIFVNFIMTLQKKFNLNFGYKWQAGLATGILMALCDKNILCCPCFPNAYLRRLFVRMRIYQIIRYNNRNFRNESFQFTINDELNASTGLGSITPVPQDVLPIVINSFSLSSTSSNDQTSHLVQQ